jgi:hypothetical protein
VKTISIDEGGVANVPLVMIKKREKGSGKKQCHENRM